LASTNKTTSLTQAGLNLIQQALSIYDQDLRLAVCNSRFGEMFNLPANLTSTGAKFSDTIRYLAENGEYGPVSDVEAFVTERVNQAKAFAPHYMERVRSNGHTISVEGNPLAQGGWITVYTDITAIKRQESLLRIHSAQLSDQLLTHSEDLARANRELASTIAALEQTKRDLTDSVTLSRTTAEMMPAHIAHVNMAEEYTYSNHKLPSVIPGRPERIEGLTVSAALGAEAYKAIKPHLDQAFGGRPSVFEFTHATNQRRVRAAFTPGRGPDGTVTGVYILSMDVTEEAQARAALMQTHKRELAAQLTSGLAHDFANLLTIILGIQSRLDKLNGLPDGARDMIATTRAAALRGGVLLDRLSNISGPRDINRSATDLGTLFQEIRALAIPSLSEQINLSTQLYDITQPVELDAGFLQDSLLNLILNARDAMQDLAGTITITARPVQDTWLDIAVSDTGPGFSPEAIDHALDPFYTTKRNDEGSGLGLSMVYDFAQLSGGLVTLANQPGSGACVTLRLPLRFAAKPASPRMVLLVEDSPEIRTNIREMLRELGHSVIEATSADEAETLATVPGVDLVLTDITLDGPRHGLDLARTLSAQSDAKPVFMMTSLPPTDKTRRAAETEFSLIGKPFSLPQLAAFLTPEPAQ
jgi:signal transduction histidine kinase